MSWRNHLLLAGHCLQLPLAVGDAVHCFAVPDVGCLLTSQPCKCAARSQPAAFLSFLHFFCRGKFGEAVAADLGVSTVGQLASTPRHELVRRYGEQRGAFLAALPLAQARAAGKKDVCVVGDAGRGSRPLCISLHTALARGLAPS